jgi:hypothetical protein
MVDKVKRITEDTLIPISLVIMLVGGVFWLTSMYNATAANSKDIAELKVKQEQYNQTVQAIWIELVTIKTRLPKDK